MMQQNYPNPDVAADIAWAGMKQILDQNPQPAKTKKPVNHYPRNVFLMSAVGVIFILMFTYYFTDKNSQKQNASISYVSKNEPLKDTLLNGTVVFLDSYSTVTELTDIKNKKRIGINGAAYFNVEKSGKMDTLYFKIGSMEVISAGSKIYLTADSNTNISSVHVQAGSVSVHTNEGEFHLTAGESLSYNEKKKEMMAKEKINVNSFSYATHIFEFTNTTLNEVAKNLQKAYGVQIEITNEKLYSCRITTRFDNLSLPDIMDILSVTLHIEYKADKENNKILVTGNGCN